MALYYIKPTFSRIFFKFSSALILAFSVPFFNISNKYALSFINLPIFFPTGHISLTKRSASLFLTKEYSFSSKIHTFLDVHHQKCPKSVKIGQNPTKSPKIAKITANIRTFAQLWARPNILCWQTL